MTKQQVMAIDVPSTLPSPNSRHRNPFWRQTLDPHSRIAHYCDRFLLLIGTFSLYIDPYFYYLPIVTNSGSITLDLRLGVFVSFIRLFGDFLLFLGMILKFRTAYDQWACSVFEKKKLVQEPKLIAKKYLKSSFIIDLLAALPLPQVYIWYHILSSKVPDAVDMYYHLTWICQIQLPPRMITTLLAYRKIENNVGIAIRNPWSGTLYILFVYGMISHFLGAALYLTYINAILTCRETFLEKEENRAMHELDQFVTKCSLKDDTVELASEAFANNVGLRSFSQKFMFCFSWGLKTFSSMGQNLKSGASIADTAWIFTVIVTGLVLFADLIARMQTCMQSVGEREEQLMIRQRELEDWTNFHQLPPLLKKRVRETAQSQFHATRGMDSEAILDSLPVDLHREIRIHLYLDHVRNLPIFKEIDDQFLHAICGQMRTFTSVGGMFIVLEGDPVQQVLFILSGNLEMFSVHGGSSYETLGPGGICGQELLTWAFLSSTSTRSLPSSTYSVRCLTDVQAVSLLARDVKLLAVQFDYSPNFLDALGCQSS